MSREEIKMEIFRLVLDTKNDSVLEEILMCLENSDDKNDEEGEFEIIPGLPRTLEEKLASVEKGMEDYRQGRSITHEEFLKEIETWGFVGALAQEKQ